MVLDKDIPRVFVTEDQIDISDKWITAKFSSELLLYAKNLDILWQTPDIREKILTGLTVGFIQVFISIWRESLCNVCIVVFLISIEQFKNEQLIFVKPLKTAMT